MSQISSVIYEKHTGAFDTLYTKMKYVNLVRGILGQKRKSPLRVEGFAKYAVCRRGL